MEIRKKLGAKKAEKSFEISAFLVFSRSDLNRPKDLWRTDEKDISGSFRMDLNSCVNEASAYADMKH